MAADRESRGSELMNTSISDNHLSPFSHAKKSQFTYRVRGIPLAYTPKKAEELLRSVLELDGTRANVLVRSMAISPDQKTKMITVDFKALPACLTSDKNEWSFEIPDDEGGDARNDVDDNDEDDDIIPKLPTITIDTHFKGITILRSFKDVSKHKVDYIAISGLGGHAFGSFKERAGSHMWLRDSLPYDLPSARIILYGYDTQLHGSHTFQDLEALASPLRLDLQALAVQESSSAKPQTKPLIFLAHSLGGLVVKEAIIQMKRDENHQELLNSIYGALFFGVPNQGMEIASLVPMVKDQPNQALLHSLGKESQILRNQCRDFPKAFDYQDSEIICFYETEMSPTAARHGTEWKMTGPLSILVDSSSARHGRPWENEAHHCLALKRTHSDLVKFSSNDEDYERVLTTLKRMAYTAVLKIPRGMSSAEVEYLHRIQRWLSPPDPSANHKKARGRCQSNTGLWFTNGESFSKWKTSNGSFLWLHGIPGCGKTILSSTIIQKLKDQFQADRKVVVVYFYFDFNDKEKQETEHLLSSLLAQLAQHASKSNKHVPEALKELYAGSKNTADGKKLPPTFDGMIAALVILVSEFDQAYICLDALDECTNRKRLLNLLKRVLEESTTHLHILTTSRKERNLEASLTKMATKCIELQNAGVDADIQAYIKDQVGKDWEYTEPPAKVKEDIEKMLMKNAKGMFQWVACQIDVLRTCISHDGIVQALESLPETLDETYERVLRSIPANRSKDALRMLQWLVFSARPLRIDEVAELLVANPESRPDFDLKRRPFDPQDIASYCGSLVTIQNSTKEIRLAHYSVQEFLVSDRLTSGCEIYKVIEQPANISIAKTCLTYLMGAPELSLPVMLKELPLFEYAAEYWMEHATAVEDTYTDDLDHCIARFLECEVAQSSWIKVFDPDDPWKDPKGDYEVRVINPPLYIASLAGLQGPVKLLLENGADVNARGGYYGNALQAASLEGHEAVVRLLLEKGADVNAQGGLFGNALRAASLEGHEAVVMLLLEKGADITAHGAYYGNALRAASSKGHQAVVRLLQSALPSSSVVCFP